MSVAQVVCLLLVGIIVGALITLAIVNRGVANGVFLISKNDEDQVMYTMQLEEEPEMLAKRKSLRFKVVRPKS